MSANLPRRLNRELQDIARDAEASGVLAWPLGDDIRQMRGRFLGPPDTPYAGGTYVVSISATNEYPFKPPSFSFETKIWHPNVSSVTGTICLDSLGSGWTPVQTIKSILISLRVLLEKPNPSDPQDAEVAKTMLSDPESFARQAHEWAVVYAGAPRNPAGTWPGYENSSSDMTPRPRRPEDFRGYHPNLVARFADMGFQHDAILDAFEHVKIDTLGGADYQLEEAYVGDVTSHLLGEH